VAARIQQALGDAKRVLNVGAGTGSYEPTGRCIAVEPSELMLSRRRPGSAPAVRAVAEQLPFPAQSFDAAIAIFTVHHWSDHRAGLAEVRRVAAGPIVVLTWDSDAFAQRFWLVRDYLPEAVATDRGLPSVSDIGAALGPHRVETLAVPHDCTDGFSAAYWRRPEMYLDPDARAAISNLALLPAGVVDRMAAALRADLDSGAWHRRNAELIDLEELDCGYRLLISDGRPGDDPRPADDSTRP